MILQNRSLISLVFYDALYLKTSAQTKCIYRPKYNATFKWILKIQSMKEKLWNTFIPNYGCCFFFFFEHNVRITLFDPSTFLHCYVTITIFRDVVRNESKIDFPPTPFSLLKILSYDCSVIIHSRALRNPQHFRVVRPILSYHVPTLNGSLDISFSRGPCRRNYFLDELSHTVLTIVVLFLNLPD